MCNYSIIIAALGSDIEKDICKVDRNSISDQRLEYNLNKYWAWNLFNWNEYSFADGPAVFIEFN